jgi:uncharacterized protein (UPF0147 family)
MKSVRNSKNAVAKNATTLMSEQEQAVMLLSQGKTPSEVGEELNLDPELLRAWGQEAGFEAAMNQQHDETLTSNTRRLRSLLSKAIDTMEEVMSDSEAPPNVRLSAALQLLKLGNLGKRVEMAAGPLTAEEVERARAKDAMFKALADPF